MVLPVTHSRQAHNRSMSQTLIPKVAKVGGPMYPHCAILIERGSWDISKSQGSSSAQLAVGMRWLGAALGAASLAVCTDANAYIRELLPVLTPLGAEVAQLHLTNRHNVIVHTAVKSMLLANSCLWLGIQCLRQWPTCSATTYLNTCIFKA